MRLYFKHCFDNWLTNMWSMSMNIQTTDTYYYKMQYIFSRENGISACYIYTIVSCDAWNWKYITQASNIIFPMNDLSSRVLIKRKSNYTLHTKTHFIEDTLYIVWYLTVYVVAFIYSAIGIDAIYKIFKHIID